MAIRTLLIGSAQRLTTPASGIQNRLFACSAPLSLRICSGRAAWPHTWSWAHRNFRLRPMPGLKLTGRQSTRDRMFRRLTLFGIAANQEIDMSVQAGIWNFDGKPVDRKLLGDFRASLI